MNQSPTGDFGSTTTLSSHTEVVLCVVVDVSHRCLFTGSVDSTVRKWDLESHKCQAMYTGHQGFVVKLSLGYVDVVEHHADPLASLMHTNGLKSGTHRKLALFSAGDDRTVRQWSVDHDEQRPLADGEPLLGVCVHTFKGHKATVTALLIGSSVLYSGSSDGCIKVWSVNERRLLRTIPHAHTEPVWSLVEVSSRLVSVCSGGFVKLWDRADRVDSYSEIHFENSRLRSAVCTGSTIFAAGGDGKIYVIGVSTTTSDKTSGNEENDGGALPLHCMGIIEHHQKQVNSLTIEHCHLVSCSFDFSVCAWDIGELLAPIDTKDPAVIPSSLPHAAVAPDTTAAVASNIPSGQAGSNDDDRRRLQRASGQRANATTTYAEEIDKEAPSAALPLNFVLESLKEKVEASYLTREFFCFAGFLILFVFAFVAARPIEETYYMQEAFSNTLVSAQLPSFKSGRTFSDITTTALFFSWLRLAVQELWKDRSALTFPSINGQNILIGGLLVRQQRARSDSCAVNSNFLSPTAFPCYGRLDSGDGQATEPYYCPNTSRCTLNASNQSVLLASLGLPPSGFYFSELAGSAVEGTIMNYPKGGYAVEWSFSNHSLQEVLLQVHALEALGFVDEVASRFVEVSFFAYNPSIDVFFRFRYVFEIPYGGTWFPLYRAESFELYTAETGRYSLQIAFFVAVLAWWGWLCGQGFRAWKAKKLIPFLADAWNWVEFCNLVCFLVLFGNHFAWIGQSNSIDLGSILTTTSYPVQAEAALKNFRNVMWYQSINTILMFIRAFEYVKLSERLSHIMRTISIAQRSLYGVLVLFVYVIVTFALMGHRVYGVAIFDFRTFSSSCVTLFRALMRDTPYDAMSMENMSMTVFFFWFFLLFAQFALLNFIVAILSDGFHQEASSKATIPLDVTINKAFRDGRFECLPRRIRWRVALLLDRTSQTDLTHNIWQNLAHVRDKMIDVEAAERYDYDEVDHVLMVKEDLSRYARPNFEKARRSSEPGSQKKIDGSDEAAGETVENNGNITKPKRTSLFSVIRECIKTHTADGKRFVDELWNDLVWEHHHRQLSSKGLEELQREALVFENVEEVLRPTVEILSTRANEIFPRAQSLIMRLQLVARALERADAQL